MVKAILEGRKSVTRRVIKPSPGTQSGWLSMKNLHGFVQSGEMIEGGWQMWHPNGGPRSPYGWIKCPFGQPGDRLWVRETFTMASGNGIYPIYRADAVEDDSGEREGIWVGEKFYGWDGGPRWTPSIHMPRKMSRITLEITGVRVERLAEITDEDARAEGLMPRRAEGHLHFSERQEFARTWDEIYGVGAAEASHWVWVIEFKRIEVANG